MHQGGLEPATSPFSIGAAVVWGPWDGHEGGCDGAAAACVYGCGWYVQPEGMGGWGGGGGGGQE